MRKNKFVKVLLALGLLLVFCNGCSQEEEIIIEDEEIVEEDVVEEEEIVVNVAPEGTYFSELTGEPIDESLYGQRPIAVMIDNENVSYPHYGVAESDVVYEMINNIYNSRITRLFCILKDWGSITQMGSIRSTRSTNIILSGEWNSVLCHDGAPTYVPSLYFTKDYATEHFNARFSRVDNGKATEFTEYILSGDIEDAFEATGYSVTYNEYAPDYPEDRETHFKYVDYYEDYDNETSLEDYEDRFEATSIALPFWHNNSRLIYNEETGTYDYYSYNSQHIDAEDDEPLTFKNLIIQNCSFTVENEKGGYVVYNVVASDMEGYYLTNGQCIKITWTKTSETAITRYYELDGNEIEINRGKTYIALVPSDTWEDVEFNTY